MHSSLQKMEFRWKFRMFSIIQNLEAEIWKQLLEEYILNIELFRTNRGSLILEASTIKV